MKNRLTWIAAWGLGCFAMSVVVIYMMVFINGLYWVVPVVGVGLPTVGLLLAFLGLLPGTRPPTEVFVRMLPSGESALQRVQAVRIKSRFYRIITRNQSNEPWEFSTGDVVECTERDLPNGQRGLVAILRA